MSDRSNSELDHVRSVLARHRKDITERYRALGTGIGKRSRADPTRVIVVYLESAADRPTEPASVEDIPLKFEVTGPVSFLKRAVRKETS